MNREIKFKGQPIGKGGIWMVGIGAYKTHTAEHLVLNAKGDYVEVVHLCQYTGLTDKNGKEIYEGDIVTIGLCTALVTWNEELATFALQFDFENKVGRKSLGEWDDMIVISNIHDKAFSARTTA